MCAAIMVTATNSMARADKLDDIIKERMEQQHIPALSVAVVKDGKIETARGYGLANIELNVPATKDTVYEIGSITKQFTATLAMMLVEDGKLKLDDKISAYLPKTPEIWKDITVRHLMNHTSGIKGYTEVGDFFKLARNPHTQEEIVGMVSGMPLEFTPGSKWTYSNTGYFLLGMIIEKAGGKSYEALLEERIFKPLGMTKTRSCDPDVIIPNRAASYSWTGKGYRNMFPLHASAAYSAGFLVSTVEDMAKWDAALYSEKLLKKSSLEQMWTATKLADGTNADYGFGWGVSKRNGHRAIEHGGGTAGFLSNISRYIDDKLTIIVLTNCNNANPGVLTQSIAGLTLPALAPQELKTIADKNPKITTLLTKVIKDAAEGKADESLFAPEVAKLIVPKIKEGKEQFAQFGAFKSLTLVSETMNAEAYIYKYKAEFVKITLLMTAVFNPEGKIAGLGLQPN
jgi:D-alanyl-D-alanine carboxypeptidase